MSKAALQSCSLSKPIHAHTDEYRKTIHFNGGSHACRDAPKAEHVQYYARLIMHLCLEQISSPSKSSTSSDATLDFVRPSSLEY